MLHQVVINPQNPNGAVIAGPAQALYGDEPVIVVVDLTDLSAKQASSLNDLFDIPSSYAGKPLGPNVRLIAVMTPDMILSPAFSSDFFSRLPLCRRPSPGSCNTMPQVAVFDAAAMAPMPHINLFHEVDTAIETLVGNPGLDHHGQMAAIPGALVSAIQTGQPGIIIEDGPWDDPKFRVWIDRLLALRKLDFNGEPITIPDHFQIFKREGISTPELERFRSCAIQTWGGEPCDLTFNQNSVENFHVSVHINAHQTLCVSPGLSGDRIKISGDLTPAQWAKFLTQISRLNTERALALKAPIQIFIAPNTTLSFLYAVGVEIKPADSELRTTPTLIPTLTYRPGVHLIQTTDNDYSLAQLKASLPSPPLFFDISKSMDDDAPFQSTRIHSFENRLLSSTDTELIGGLEKEIPIIVRGIGTHAGVKRLLETLLEVPPYLILNGEKRVFPRANVTFLGSAPEIERFSADYQVHTIDQTTLIDSFGLAPDAKKLILHLEKELSLPLSWALLDRVVAAGGGDPNPGTWTPAIKTTLLPMLKSNPCAYAFAKCALSRFQAPPTESSPPTLDRHRLEALASQQLAGKPVSLWEWATAFQNLPWPDQIKEFKLASFPPILRDQIGKAIVELGAQNQDEQAILLGFFPPRFGDISGWTAWDKPQKTSEIRLKKATTQLAHEIQNTATSLFFLQGAPGSGKSYVASQLQATLPGAELFGPLTVGPDVSFEALVGTIEKQGDHSAFGAGRLIQWAESTSEFPLLFIDEANLAPKGFWNIIRGVFDTPPQLVINGKTYPLAAGHKIIFTGNRTGLSGRVEDPLVMAQARIIHFKPMTHSVIQTLVDRELAQIPEGLLRPEFSADLSTMILEFDRVLKACLPKHEFTIRDHKEWIHRFHVALRSRSPQTPLSLGSLKSVLGHSVIESIGQELSSDQRTSLQTWIVSRHACPTEWHQVEDENQTIWEALKVELKAGSPSLDFESDAAKDLALLIYKELRIRAMDTDGTLPNRGKRGLLVQGPPARGKDALYDAFSRCPSFADAFKDAIHFTCKVGSDYGLLVNQIKDAKQRGLLIALSETNLLPSAIIEGLLNDALTGESAPGFHLFVFQNSPQFSGREPFSPPLESRFNSVEIDDYSPETLKNNLLPTWLKRVPDGPEKSNLIDALFEFHCAISSACRARGTNLTPTNRQLIQVCTECTQDPTLLEDAVRRDALLNQTYAVYLPAQILFPGSVVAQSSTASMSSSKTGEKPLEFDKIAAGFEFLEGPLSYVDTPPPHASRFTKEVWVKTTERISAEIARVLPPPPPGEPSEITGAIVTEAKPNVKPVRTHRRASATPPPPPIKKIPNTTTSFFNQLFGRSTKSAPKISNPETIDFTNDALRPQKAVKLDTATGPKLSSPNYKLRPMFNDSRMPFAMERHHTLSRIKMDHKGFRVKALETPPNWTHIHAEKRAPLVPESLEQHVGSFLVELKKRQWVTIPSWAADQKILAYHSDSDRPLDFAKDEVTGQWAVRGKSTAKIDLQVLIDLSDDINTCRARANEVPRGINFDRSRPVSQACPPNIQRLFDQINIKGRLGISENAPDDIKLATLAAYFQSFEEKPMVTLETLGLSTTEYRAIRAHPGLDSVLQIVLGKTGVCRHRAETFLLVAQYLQIPAQLQCNYRHEFVEIPVILDAQKGLLKVDLGGGADNGRTQTEFPNHAAGLTPRSSASANERRRPLESVDLACLAGGVPEKPGHPAIPTREARRIQQNTEFKSSLELFISDPTSQEKKIKLFHSMIGLSKTSELTDLFPPDLAPEFQWIPDILSSDPDKVADAFCFSFIILEQDPFPEKFVASILNNQAMTYSNLQLLRKKIAVQLLTTCAVQLQKHLNWLLLFETAFTTLLRDGKWEDIQYRMQLSQRLETTIDTDNKTHHFHDFLFAIIDEHFLEEKFLHPDFNGSLMGNYAELILANKRDTFQGVTPSQVAQWTFLINRFKGNDFSNSMDPAPKHCRSLFNKIVGNLSQWGDAPICSDLLALAWELQDPQATYTIGSQMMERGYPIGTSFNSYVDKGIQALLAAEQSWKQWGNEIEGSLNEDEWACKMISNWYLTLKQNNIEWATVQNISTGTANSFLLGYLNFPAVRDSIDSSRLTLNPNEPLDCCILAIRVLGTPGLTAEDTANQLPSTFFSTSPHSFFSKARDMLLADLPHDMLKDLVKAFYKNSINEGLINKFWDYIDTKLTWDVAREIIADDDPYSIALWQTWKKINPADDSRNIALFPQDATSFVGLLCSPSATCDDLRTVDFQRSDGTLNEGALALMTHPTVRGKHPEFVLDFDEKLNGLRITKQLMQHMSPDDFSSEFSQLVGYPHYLWAGSLAFLLELSRSEAQCIKAVQTRKFAEDNPILAEGLESDFANKIKYATSRFCELIEETDPTLLVKICPKPYQAILKQVVTMLADCEIMDSTQGIFLAQALDLPSIAYRLASQKSYEALTRFLEQPVSPKVRTLVLLVLKEKEMLASQIENIEWTYPEIKQWAVLLRASTVELMIQSQYHSELLVFFMARRKGLQIFSNLQLPMDSKFQEWLQMLRMIQTRGPDVPDQFPSGFFDKSLNDVLKLVRAVCLEPVPEEMFIHLLHRFDPAEMLTFIDSDKKWDAARSVLAKTQASGQNIDRYSGQLWDIWGTLNPGADPRITALKSEDSATHEGLLRSPTVLLEDFKTFPNDRRLVPLVETWMSSGNAANAMRDPSTSVWQWRFNLASQLVHLLSTKLDPDSARILAKFYVHFNTFPADDIPCGDSAQFYPAVFSELEANPKFLHRAVAIIRNWHFMSHERRIHPQEFALFSDFFAQHISTLVRPKKNIDVILHCGISEPENSKLRLMIKQSIKTQFRQKTVLDNPDIGGPSGPIVKLPLNAPTSDDIAHKWSGSQPPNINRWITAKPAFPVKSFSKSPLKTLVIVADQTFLETLPLEFLASLQASTSVVLAQPDLQFIEVKSSRNWVSRAGNIGAYVGIFEDALSREPGVRVAGKKKLEALLAKWREIN